jgi:MYXO-CTERM domain-containing protein
MTGQDIPEDPQQLRAAIEETRSELGDTAEALAAKADVKGQVRESVEERKQQLRDQRDQAQARVAGAAGQARSKPAPYVGGAVAALLLLLVVRRRRRS